MNKSGFLLVLSLFISNVSQAEFRRFQLRKPTKQFDSYETGKYKHKVSVYPKLTRIVKMDGKRYVDRDCYDAFPFVECMYGIHEKKRIFAIVDVDEESWQYQELFRAYEKNPGNEY